MTYLFFIRRGLNEVMLSTALMRRLKTFFPDTLVYYATDPEFYNVLEPSNYVAGLFDINTVLENHIGDLKDLGVEFMIDFDRSSYSRSVAKALDLPKKRRVKMRLRAESRELDASFFKLHINYDNCGLLYMISRSHDIKGEDLPVSHRAGYYAFPLTRTQITNYPDGFIEEFLKKLDHPVILLGNNEDRDRAAKYSQLDPVKIYNATGKFSFEERADIIKKAKLVLLFGNEYLQLTAATNRPILLVEGKKMVTQQPMYHKAILAKPDRYFHKFRAYYQILPGVLRIQKKDGVDKLLLSLREQLSTIVVRTPIII